MANKKEAVKEVVDTGAVTDAEVVTKKRETVKIQDLVKNPGPSDKDTIGWWDAGFAWLDASRGSMTPEAVETVSVFLTKARSDSTNK